MNIRVISPHGFGQCINNNNRGQTTVSLWSWPGPFDFVVTARAADIVAKWIDFFVLHKPVKSERITRRLK